MLYTFFGSVKQDCTAIIKTDGNPVLCPKIKKVHFTGLSNVPILPKFEAVGEFVGKTPKEKKQCNALLNGGPEVTVGNQALEEQIAT